MFQRSLMGRVAGGAWAVPAVVSALVSVALAGVVFAGLMPRESIAERSLLAGPVATVDLEKLINELEEFKEADAVLQEAQQRRQRTIGEMRAEFEGLRSELNLIPAEDADARYEIEAQLYEQEQLIQARAEIFAGQANREFVETVRGIYPKVIEGVREVAEEGGYDLVVSNMLDEQLTARSRAEVIGQLSSQFLLYAADGTDITQQVVQRMNNKFVAGR